MGGMCMYIYVWKFLRNERQCANRRWCSPTRHTSLLRWLPSMWCSNQLHLIAFTNVYCMQHHLRWQKAIPFRQSQYFPACCSQSEHFQSEHFQFEYFQSLNIHFQSLNINLNISNLNISNFDMICHSPVWRVWSLRSTEIVEQFHCLALILRHMDDLGAH